MSLTSWRQRPTLHRSPCTPSLLCHTPVWPLLPLFPTPEGKQEVQCKAEEFKWIEYILLDRQKLK